MFIAVLFTISKIWKQPKHTLMDKWIKKIWYIYTVEYYSVLKHYEILSFTTIRMDFESVMLSEMSDKDKYHMILICEI